MKEALFYVAITIIVFPGVTLLGLYLFGLITGQKLVEADPDDDSFRNSESGPDYGGFVLSPKAERNMPRIDIDAAWIIQNIGSCRTELQLKSCKTMMGLFEKAYPRSDTHIDQMLDHLLQAENRISLFV